MDLEKGARMFLVKQKDLKEGMRIWNKISGDIAVVWTENGKLVAAADEYIPVIRKIRTGRNAGRNERTKWLAANCAIIPQEKGDLQPGMMVRNLNSDQIGEVCRTQNCADHCVVVRRRYQSGRNKGRMAQSLWRLHNLIILSAGKQS